MQDSGFDNPFSRIEQKRIIPSLDIQARTVASDKHPDRNEDAMFNLSEKRAVGVFDGISGYDADGDASKIAKEQVSEALQRLYDGLNLQRAEGVVRQAITNANNVLYKQAQTEHNNMDTTASVVYIYEGDGGERKAIVGNVGDSRVYLLRNGKLEQITLDDNRVRSAIPNEQQARQLQSKLNNVIDPQRELTNREQKFFNSRNQIMQFLGQSSVEPRVHTIDFFPLDKLHVCSDGISDNLTDTEIQQIMNKSPNSTEAVESLIKESQTRSRSDNFRAKFDDMTAIVIGKTQSVSGGVAKKEVVHPNDQKTQEANRLQKGASVRVQRNSGVFESGWVIDKFDPSTGDAIVIKVEDDYLKKQIPRTELERLNRPATIQDIPYAEDLCQLIDILNRIRGLQGSQSFYKSSELIRIINDVMANRAPLKRITRTGGLRQKVGDLIEQNKVRKKI